MIMFNYKYLTRDHLKGFDSYKYKCIDTSPLSRYVMHPFWNTIVKVIPKSIAPNLLTFIGFLMIVADVLLLTYYDYDYDTSSLHTEGQIPYWVFTACGVLLFLAYTLDGIDGKQARRIGVSGPLGELFDHGLDSWIVFLIPFCLISIFGQDEYSLPVFRGFLIVVSIVLNFYVSHVEKYNTGALYLPWGYDVSMWVASLLFIVAGVKGPETFKTYVFGNVTFALALEIAIHTTGLLTTLPVTIYNIYLSRKLGTGKKRSPLGMLRPVWAMLSIMALMMYWISRSPNNILEQDLRVFTLLFGTLFSNVATRLIVSQMSSQLCDVVSWLFWPLSLAVGVSLLRPQLELTALYAVTALCIAAHVHYGVCVVNQLCEHLNIRCFVVKKSIAKRKK